MLTSPLIAIFFWQTIVIAQIGRSNGHFHGDQMSISNSRQSLLENAFMMEPKLAHDDDSDASNEDTVGAEDISDVSENGYELSTGSHDTKMIKKRELKRRGACASRPCVLDPPRQGSTDSSPQRGRSPVRNEPSQRAIAGPSNVQAERPVRIDTASSSQTGKPPAAARMHEKSTKGTSRDKSPVAVPYEISNIMLGSQNNKIRGYQHEAVKALQAQREHLQEGRNIYKEMWRKDRPITDEQRTAMSRSFDEAMNKKDRSADLVQENHEKLHADMVKKSYMLNAGMYVKRKQQMTEASMVRAGPKPKFATWANPTAPEMLAEKMSKVVKGTRMRIENYTRGRDIRADIPWDENHQ